MVQPGPGRSPRDQSKRELLTEKRGGTLGISVDNEEELLHGMVKEWSFLSLLQCGSQWFYIQLREEGRAPPPGNPPMEPFLLLRDKSPLQHLCPPDLPPALGTDFWPQTLSSHHAPWTPQAAL